MEKAEMYDQSFRQLEALLEEAADPLTVMVTVCAVLKSNMDHHDWVGFYRFKEGRLEIGPYQGSVGCLFIELGKGVCGSAAAQRRTICVDDVNSFPGHIACDARSLSEIVVPVIDAAGTLLGVLDVDSARPAAFDDLDRQWLERMVRRFLVDPEFVMRTSIG